MNYNCIETHQKEKEREIEREYVLVVEGIDDMRFFEGLLKRSNDIDFDINNIQIITTNGKSGFPGKIQWVSRPDRMKKITRIGFVRDADEHPAYSAFQSVCSHLKTNGFPVPKTMSEVTEGHPQCGIFIMPDNESGGMLESLCLESIQNQVVLVEAIDQYMRGVEKNDAEMYGKLNQPKSRILTYLAGRHPYSNTVGPGAEKKHFDFSRTCFSRVKHFLNRLYR